MNQSSHKQADIMAHARVIRQQCEVKVEVKAGKGQYDQLCVQDTAIQTCYQPQVPGPPFTVDLSISLVIHPP